MKDVAETAEILGVPFRAYDGRLSTSLRCPFCPKLMFQRWFWKYFSVDDYDYLWLPDSDISLSDLDWRRFWTTHHKFAGKPLVSQPLIRQGTPDKVFFNNADQWSACDDARFVTTTFIEQGFPVYDAKFFQYFMQTMVPFADMQYQRQSDWGADSIVCHVASLYAEANNIDRPACAMILDSTVDHCDYRDISKHKKFVHGSWLIMQDVVKLLAGANATLAKELNMSSLAFPESLLPPCEFSLDRVRACILFNDVDLQHRVDDSFNPSTPRDKEWIDSVLAYYRDRRPEHGLLLADTPNVTASLQFEGMDLPFPYATCNGTDTPRARLKYRNHRRAFYYLP